VVEDDVGDPPDRIVVTTSSVAEARSSGSTVRWYARVSASSSGSFP